MQMIKRFIDVVPGMKKDTFGNRYIIVNREDGQRPTTMISCHTDTVHTNPGRQLLARDHRSDVYMLNEPAPCEEFSDRFETRNARPEFSVGHNMAKPRKKESLKAAKFRYEKQCLGADDGAGVYAALCMIYAGVPAMYIFHRAEEIGGYGSQWIADHQPNRLKGLKRCIALDRRGENDIITHQMMGRCCSDDFAWVLATSLGMKHQPCAFGSFTDSANYTDFIPECTNVSVGYGLEHSAREFVDFAYLTCLIEALCEMDFDSLPVVRTPGTCMDWRDELAEEKAAKMDRARMATKKVFSSTTYDDLKDSLDTGAINVTPSRIYPAATAGRLPMGLSERPSDRVMGIAKMGESDAVRTARAYLDQYIDPLDLDVSEDRLMMEIAEADKKWHEQRQGMSQEEREYADWLESRWFDDDQTTAGTVTDLKGGKR
jgi:hypothetical protein